jgi:tetrapyrrole methylase family protein / MazG family protein
VPTSDPTLTILGLGPGDPSLLTEAATRHLQTLERLVLRTTIHPTIAGLPDHLETESFDALYEQATSFEEIYAEIAEGLLARVRAGEDVTYAVPGHPLVAEATTRRLLAAARAEQIPTRIIAGLSFLEPVCEALGVDPFEHGLQLLDALELVPPRGAPWNGDDAWLHKQGGDGYEPPVVPFPLIPTRPALLSQVYNRRVASDAKLTLLQRYPGDHLLTIVWSAGNAEGSRTRAVALSELDHQPDLDHLTSVYLPALPPIEDLRGIDGAGWVIARLLGPGGCPWDREQTHQSLRPYLLEETHEALEALDAGDMHALGEELGDVLLQVLLHSEMARQAGEFDIGDVFGELTSKLIRRHPHVFGEVEVGGSSEVLRNWESIKRSEQAARGAKPKGPLDGIPAGLPALAAAQKLGEKAARSGFDWAGLDGVWAKIDEELAELRAAPPAEQEEELGDLLFVLVRLASWLSVDAETALRAASVKFRHRYTAMQDLAGERPLSDLSTVELQLLWNRASGRR